MTTVWFLVIIGTMILEIATPSALISIWFSLGGIVALVSSLFKISTGIQILIFTIVSILSFILIRPLATKYLRGNIVATNADRFINETGVVTKDITENNWGEVFIKSTYWSAVEVNGKNIEKGKKVVVVAIEGAKLLVKEV